jgi:flagellar basal body rod protein FlgC
MDLSKTLELSAQGMTAQSTRLQVVAQNIANADTRP